MKSGMRSEGNLTTEDSIHSTRAFVPAIPFVIFTSSLPDISDDIVDSDIPAETSGMLLCPCFDNSEFTSMHAEQAALAQQHHSRGMTN